MVLFMAGGDDLPGHKNIAKNRVSWGLLRGPIRSHFRRADLGVGTPQNGKKTHLQCFGMLIL